MIRLVLAIALGLAWSLAAVRPVSDPALPLPLSVPGPSMWQGHPMRDWVPEPVTTR